VLHIDENDHTRLKVTTMKKMRVMKCSCTWNTFRTHRQPKFLKLFAINLLFNLRLRRKHESMLKHH
jgi:hypothetical protein